MTDDIKQAQDDINRKINDAYDRLEQLSVDEVKLAEEMEELNKERARLTILSEVSDQLEKLEKMGGAHLFWGDDYDREQAVAIQKRVRDMVINYDEKYSEVKSRIDNLDEDRESLAAKINVLNDESLGLEARKEARESEFVITREMSEQPFRPMRMPWNRQDEDQKRYRFILAIVMLVTFVLGVLVPLYDIPIPDRVEVVEVPERLAKLVAPKPPPPPPPQPKKQEEKKPEEKTAKKKEEKPKPKEKTKVRKKAERAGLMAFKDDFADLIDDTPVAKLGSSAKISGKGSKAKKTTRSLVTSNVGGASAGINTAALSRNVGGSGESIGGVEFSRVESSIGTDFAGEEAPLSSGPGPSRTDEEIQIVFDKYKAALYRIYNKELRKNPTLQGKMVLKITIEPDGSVSACSVDSSDMDSPDLDKKIAARVKRFNFGAKEGVPTITILYPIDFLPAT